MMRYTYYTDNKSLVVCVVTYAGKTVKGIAKCNTEQDTFDLQKGKELAKLRCDYKLAEKRLHKAEERQWEACRALNAAMAKRAQAQERTALRYKEFQEAKANLFARELNMFH